MESAVYWLLFNLLSIVVLAFYSMTEMAAVSFNKVRLHYYVSKGIKQAIWLNWLLQHPSRLFGTTLIGVNVAMVAGSECAREFHSAIGLSPDLAPLSQVIIVVIFGELAPMFAARHYAEHVGMLGARFLYISAKLMTPMIWLAGVISRACEWITGSKELKPNIFLSQEELQMLLERDDEGPTPAETEEVSDIAGNIFTLRSRDVKQAMTPIHKIPLLPAYATVAQMRELLQRSGANYVALYQKKISNIVGIAFPRDLVRVPDSKRIKEHARAPWFVTQRTKIIQILKQFRRNNQSVAVILDKQGQAIGAIDLDAVLEEVFGKMAEVAGVREEAVEESAVIDRTFPGEMTIGEFNTQFSVVLHEEEEFTLSELMAKMLDHHPSVGESIYLAPFELIVKEASLLEAKTIAIKTRR